MRLFERILLPENLYFAWQKARRLFLTQDGYVDRGELAEFELNLEVSLNEIRNKFIKGIYRTNKIRPLPRPKKRNGENLVDRQYFHVSVRDQVAWIAIVNALGPELDSKMPSWSYGNRLYRTVWYEEKFSKLEIGPYRHTSGHLYRKFQNSWPLFRRHVSLTARTMVSRTKPDLNELDEAEERALSAAETEKLRYLEEGYWHDVPEREDDFLYYASIDLKQFFPKLNKESILAGLSLANSDNDGRIASLFNDMLKFSVDFTGVPSELTANVEPSFPYKTMTGLPTGLFVAGFLSNVAMQRVDGLIEKELEQNRTIAHFRFVDDHTILSYDFDKLCDWIAGYRKLLIDEGIGPEVNSEKYAPKNLGNWLKEVEKNFDERTHASEATENMRQQTVNDTKLDGRVPTKLMTKTLNQVSAIAAEDIHILDDKDLNKRLKMLEWLLGADISEREIRPDTKATFVAGQIAQLAPVLVQEENELADKVRELAARRSKSGNSTHSTEKVSKDSDQDLKEREAEILKLTKEQRRSEKKFYRRCFTLLFQALEDFPEKPLLLLRVLQFCRNTGYSGLAKIGKWLDRLRNEKNPNWANYYTGLCLQLLGQNAVSCARVLTTHGTLLSDQSAAKKHLTDISKHCMKGFRVGGDSEAWFHGVAKKEFAVSLLFVASTIVRRDHLGKLAGHLSEIARQLTNLPVEISYRDWKENTGRSPSVWAFRFESELDSRDEPSAAWQMFSEAFNMEDKNDAKAIRWYPEWISDEAWKYILRSKKGVSRSDSGWISEALANNPSRCETAKSSRIDSVRRASTNSASIPSKIRLDNWANMVSEMNAFDPRAGEWTAFEIMRQLIKPIIENKSGNAERELDRLHPQNIYLPCAWQNKGAEKFDGYALNWFEWRSFVQNGTTGNVELGAKKVSATIDYRYAAFKTNFKNEDENYRWERQLAAVGFILLGLLKMNFKTPRIWNIRGHEKFYRFPRSKWYESLKVSSRGLLLIEGCLSVRSAESRTMKRTPDLFGIREGSTSDDTIFDPPKFENPDKLYSEIENVQEVLTENQLSVSLNQPRQLIPFNLRDFSVGAVPGDDKDDPDKVE